MIAVALAAAAVLFALVQTLRLRWRASLAGRRLRARAVKAAAGEDRAGALLVNAGYAIVARQASTVWTAYVDGAPVAIALRADYVVAHGDRRLVAEVKTGRAAPHVASSATRRQLLEYRLAFDVDGVLLVDAEDDVIHEVDFAWPDGAARPLRASARPTRWRGLLFAFALGAATTLVVTAYAWRAAAP